MKCYIYFVFFFFLISYNLHQTIFKLKKGKFGKKNESGFAGKPKFKEDRQGHQNGNAREGKPGDWTCEGCSASNFAFRNECFRCKAGRTDGVVAPEKKGQNFPAREGDWDCAACGNNNFAFRRECHRCNAPKSGEEGGASEGGFKKFGKDGNRQSFGGGRGRGGRGAPRGGRGGGGDRKSFGGFGNKSFNSSNSGDSPANKKIKFDE